MIEKSRNRQAAKFYPIKHGCPTMAPGTSFKVGDVVQMASGGPKMTVQSVAEERGKLWVYCVWFAGARREAASFLPETLKKVPKDDKTK